MTTQKIKAHIRCMPWTAISIICICNYNTLSVVFGTLFVILCFTFVLVLCWIHHIYWEGCVPRNYALCYYNFQDHLNKVQSPRLDMMCTSWHMTQVIVPLVQQLKISPNCVFGAFSALFEILCFRFVFCAVLMHHIYRGGYVPLNYASGEGIVALYAAPNPFLLNKICLNQLCILNWCIHYQTGQNGSASDRCHESIPLPT